MNKKSLSIGICIVAALCILGVIGISLFEGKIQDSIKKELASNGITCGKIDYSLISDKLLLADVIGNIEIMKMQQQFKVSQVEIDKPSLDALDPAVSGQPLVAKTIVLKNIQQQTKGNQVEGISTTAEVRIEGWRQNLGKVRQEWEKNPKSEAFFTAALNYSIDSLSLIDSKNLSKQGNFQFATQMENMLSQNLHGTIFPSHRVEKFHASISDPSKKNLPSNLNLRLDLLELTNFRLPLSPSMLKVLSEIDPQKQQENEILIEKRVLPLLKDYLDEGSPWAKMRLAGITVDWSQAGSTRPNNFFTLQELSNQLSFNQPYKFELALQNFFVPNGMTLINQELELTDIPLGAENKDVRMNTSLKVDLPSWNDLGNVALDIDITGLAGLACHLTMQPAGEMPNDADEIEKWIEKIAFGKSELRYADKGLMAWLFNMMVKQNDQSPQSLLAELKSDAAKELSPLPISGLSNAVAVMLDNPGTLTLSANPDIPLNAAALTLAFMLNPSALNLKAVAEPGAKTLMESVK